ncbi:MAG: peptide chain release factor N(5)-glutamine methyltransferase [Burkholderiaceae bacterium]|jgi:release factor glutamine methyltransferase|nr:peptide chain release factor N(5)-glutamine methyltransferase [Burkholderiaceae bacterium]
MPDSMPTVQQALQQAQARGLARIDAQMLLLHVLDRAAAGRAWLLTHDQEMLGDGQARAYEALCARRQEGEPVAYLVGRKEFYGLDLAVDARVLDPRPDTETLVDWALELMPADGGHALPWRVVDLGTGSGAIALALQSQRTKARVWAVDASADALAVAGANARRLELPLRLVQGSWLQALADQEPFDLIVSNPPYIRSDDPHLADLVHEPLSALASGTDGLDDIRAIIVQAPERLRPEGWLLLEHGWDQAEAVAGLLRAAGFSAVQHRHDLGGIARCTGGQWQGHGSAIPHGSQV